MSPGNSVSVTSLGSITSDLDLPDVPTQYPLISTAQAGTLSRTAAGSRSKRPSSATTPRLTGSCEKKTSAGLLAPSSASVPAKVALFAYLTSTSTPDDTANSTIISATKLSFLPLYMTRVPSTSASCDTSSAEPWSPAGSCFPVVLEQAFKTIMKAIKIIII